jgi:hypothetical protein
MTQVKLHAVVQTNFGWAMPTKICRSVFFLLCALSSIRDSSTSRCSLSPRASLLALWLWTLRPRSRRLDLLRARWRVLLLLGLIGWRWTSHALVVMCTRNGSCALSHLRQPSSWFFLLIILSGDVEQNPGPKPFSSQERSSCTRSSQDVGAGQFPCPVLHCGSVFLLTSSLHNHVNAHLLSKVEVPAEYFEKFQRERCPQCCKAYAKSRLSSHCCRALVTVSGASSLNHHDSCVASEHDVATLPALDVIFGQQVKTVKRVPALLRDEWASILAKCCLDIVSDPSNLVCYINGYSCSPKLFCAMSPELVEIKRVFLRD